MLNRSAISKSTDRRICDGLNRIFRKEKGSSAGQFIMDQRMDLAVWLLRHKNLAVTDVAERVGIEMIRIFTVFSKKGTGARRRSTGSCIYETGADSLISKTV